MFQPSVIEISKSALQQNIVFIKAFLNKGVKLSCVVKGNAYGHGIETYIPIAEEAGVDHFSVFSADEAFRVKQICKADTGVMIMGFIDYSELEWAIEQEVEFYVFDNSRLLAAITAARKLNMKARIHLEVETGMNRTGYDLKNLKLALDLIKKNPDCLTVEGMCTHYAGAESIANYVRVQSQIKKFNQFRKFIEKEGIKPRRYHTACSAAAITYPKTQMDMVRVGILQYGFWPTRETYIQYIHKNGEPSLPLKRILSWKSRVMNVKMIKTGEFIGYGTTYLAQTDKVIATVPIGYALGFSRNLSNVGRVLVNGMRVSVIGIVNMNVMTIDITSAGSVKTGDEVVIIGRQGELEISVASFSELSAQVNYETLTGLPSSIPRFIVD
ncbi:MAG: alanine racemase [Lentimicrobium sp.]|nr:alanine racemase [Lentimicrobiaceae bacterium]MCO5264672.1 alanine racemase [Lentimicrobium sp.]